MIKEGVVIGKRYEISDRIGSGGMADVYRGKDHKLNRLVAVKVLKSDYRTDEGFIKKFLSEAQAAAGLMHPNVVNIYDVGQDRGLYYMVMELVDGITLKQYIERRGKLSYKETISIAIQMVNGILAAHDHHIIHRDIKPQNIIISKDGKVKVTDFGIARASSSTQTISTNVMGSVHYISPEQARGNTVDEKTDIYSAGVSIYEMVTGHVPYDGDSTVAVAVKHLNEPFPVPSEEIPDIPYALEQIILKCTQKTPALRYHDCRELIEDLKKALSTPEAAFVQLEDTAPFDTKQTVLISTEEIAERSENAKAISRTGNVSGTGKINRGGRQARPAGAPARSAAPQSSHGRGHKKEKSDDPAQSGMKRATKIMLAAAVALALLAVIFFAVQASRMLKTNPVSEDKDTKKEQVEVPSLLGLTETEAKTVLSKKRLGFNVSDRKESDRYQKGQVMEQSVAEGTKVDKNTQIQVVISTGIKPKEVTVPDVKGLPRRDAVQKLQEKGLSYSVEEKHDEAVTSDQVISSDPESGAKIEEGKSVKLIVSIGPEQVQVPGLTGMTSNQAKSALEQAGLTVGTVSEDHSEADQGTVVYQSVGEGTSVSKGTRVDYTISIGPKKEMVAVPALAGKQVNDAIAALQNAGLTVGEITKEYSSVITKDYVISQTATGQLEKGSSVGFTISLGPEQPGGNSSSQGGVSSSGSDGNHSDTPRRTQ